MNILVIPSWYLPQGGNFFEDHARSLATQGHKVSVLVSELNSLKTFSPGKFLRRRKINVKQVKGLREIRHIYWKIPFSESINVHLQSRHIHKLFKYYMKHFGSPDIIHAHCTLFAGYAASLLKKKYNVPYVVLENRSRFVADNPFAREILQKHQIPFVAKALEGADKIETVCYRIQTTFEKIHAPSKPKMLRCPNTVDIDFFLPDPGKKSPGNPFVFLCVGLLKPVKGIDVLLKSMHVLLNKYPGKFLLKIAGRGYQEEELKNLAKSLHIDDHVNFLGQLDRENLRDEMQKMDAFVLPSRFEAFGVVYIEAFACGKPVIGTRAGGPDDTIIPEVGFLVEVDDSKDLHNAMEKMYLNYHAFDEEMIRSYAVNNFSLNAVGKLHTRVFKEVLNERNPSL